MCVVLFGEPTRGKVNHIAIANIIFFAAAYVSLWLCFGVCVLSIWCFFGYMAKHIKGGDSEKIVSSISTEFDQYISTVVDQTIHTQQSTQF